MLCTILSYKVYYLENNSSVCFHKVFSVTLHSEQSLQDFDALKYKYVKQS